MDVKHCLTAVLLFFIFSTSCTPAGYRKFADIPEKEFKVEEMDLDSSRESLSSGKMTYQIGVGDEIKISIYGNPQDSTKATELGEIFGHAVDENGEVNIPLLKHVKVAGKTRKEISNLLEDMYSKYIKDPHVMFDIVKYESKFYYVTGNVKNAGKHAIKVNTNLMEAVTEIVPVEANGSTEFIYMKRGDLVVPINISDLATGKIDYSKYYLEDGDTFYVPHSSANRAYILGEVKNPGAFNISSSNYTLLDLVADAGGLVPPFSSKGRIYMVRQRAGKHLLVRLHFDEIFSGKAGAIKLLPGDRVLVSPTPLTSYNRIIQQLLPTFQLLYQGTLLYKNWFK